VDRLVDYMIALEAALVPERDFVGNLLPNRAAWLANATARHSTVSGGKLIPFFFSDSFIANACAGYHYLITSDDRPEEVRTWDQS